MNKLCTIIMILVAMMLVILGIVSLFRKKRCVSTEGYDDKIDNGNKQSKRWNDILKQEIIINKPKKLYEMAIWADKFRVKDKVKHINNLHTAKVLGSYDNADDINYDVLPNQFVMKVNHWSGDTRVIKDKNKMNKDKVKQHFNGLLTKTFSKGHEHWYGLIPPKLFVEEYLGDNINDYKFFCMNGKVVCIQIDLDRFKGHKRVLYTIDWKKLNVKYTHDNNIDVEKPSQLHNMIKICETLSKPFKFVRVDLYQINDKIYFGELTFAPDALPTGKLMKPDSFNYLLGDILQSGKIDYNKINEYILKENYDNKNNIENRLIQLEQKYGGVVQNVKRNIISKKDGRWGTDKWKSGGMQGGDRMKSQYHNYAPLYAKYLQPFIHKDIYLAEVGILTGVGLATWCDVFKNSKIYGFDIDLSNFKNNESNLKSRGGFKHNYPILNTFDQFEDNTKKIQNIIGDSKFNVVIDDGEHSDKSVLETLKSFLPYLSKDFVYFIEDNSGVHHKIKEMYPNRFNIEYKDEMTVLTRATQQNSEAKNTQLTIIITASYIPSHPSIKLIKEVIESLRYIHIDKDTNILLAHDYSDKPKYSRYLQNLEKYIKDKPNIKIVKRKTRGYLTGNVRNAIQYVDTKYVLVLQHDMPFIRKFNMHDVIKDMENNKKIKYVRFNRLNNSYSKGCDGINDLFGFQVNMQHYTYTRTPCWSDNNHICSTDYYKNIVLKDVGNAHFMEHALIKKSTNEQIHERYGTYLFGGLNNKPMIKHTDGRNSK